MSLDISDILNDWPYEPGKVSVRKVRGTDGRDKIQLRLDLGLLQMETTGRPDGQCPNDCESFLHYYERKLEEFRDAHDGSDRGFELDEQACERLRTEAMMYYHRYLACFVLEDFESVIADTQRNLRSMDICRTYAEEPSDRYVMEQYRPYVLMMCTRARAQAALRDSRAKAALASVRAGIKELDAFYNATDPENGANGSSELGILRALAKDIEESLPADPLIRLRTKLREAVREERYEAAASLRDEIRRHVTDHRHGETP